MNGAHGEVFTLTMHSHHACPPTLTPGREDTMLGDARVGSPGISGRAACSTPHARLHMDTQVEQMEVVTVGAVTQGVSFNYPLQKVICPSYADPLLKKL